jgi:hypothetical protein
MATYMGVSNGEVPQSGPATGTRDLRDGAHKAERSLVKDTIIGVLSVGFQVTSMREQFQLKAVYPGVPKMCQVSEIKRKILRPLWKSTHARDIPSHDCKDPNIAAH